MALGVRVQLQGLAAAQEMLGRLALLGADLTPIHDEIGMAMVSSQQHRFELGVAPGGTPWPISHRAKNEGGKTLIDKGLLLSRLTHQADAAGVEWGYQDRRAPVLHFGATIRAKNKKALAFSAGGKMVFRRKVTIPARPIVGVDAGDIAEIGEIVADAIERHGGAAP